MIIFSSLQPSNLLFWTITIWLFKLQFTFYYFLKTISSFTWFLNNVTFCHIHVIFPHERNLAVTVPRIIYRHDSVRWNKRNMLSLDTTCTILSVQKSLKKSLIILSSHPIGLSTVQFSSVAQLCPTLYDPMDCSMPDLPIHCQLPEFPQTYVH